MLARKERGPGNVKDYRFVLIATAEPSTRQEILECLSVQGYQTVAVERGSDALLAVAEDNIGVAIVDLSIQEPSGIRTVEILRKMRPRLPLIVLSSDDSVETGRQILQHGPFYYLLKPLNLDELAQLVGIALTPNKRSAAGTDISASRTKRGEEKGVTI